MKRYIILQRVGRNIKQLRADILWQSKEEAEEQIAFQKALYIAKEKASKKFWKDSRSDFYQPFGKCQVVKIEVPEALLKEQSNDSRPVQ